MADPVEVQGPGAVEVRRLMAPAQLPNQPVHTFTVDNTQGDYAPYFQKGTLSLEWPGATRDEARASLARYLDTVRNPDLPMSTPTSLAVQHGLEEALPPLAGAASMNPLIAGPARAGAYLATRATQPFLAPEEYRKQTEGNWGNVLGEAAMQGAEGAAGAWLANPAGQALGMLRRKLTTGSPEGYTMAPDEARVLAGEPAVPPTPGGQLPLGGPTPAGGISLGVPPPSAGTYQSPVGPGGMPAPGTPGTPGFPSPYQEGAAITGQPAYPRLSQIMPNRFTRFADSMASSLGAKGRTLTHTGQLTTNINAYSTKLAQDLTQATDPRDMARSLNQMIDMGSREVYEWQSGLWQAADQQALARSGGQLPRVSTVEDLNLLRQTPTLGGQRLSVMDKLEGAVQHELEARPIEARFRQREAERTGASTTRQATPRAESTVTQEQPVRIDPGVTATTTTTTGETLPLGGRLHTFDPATGTHQESITLGDAMQLRSAVGAVIGDAGDIGLAAADIRVARAWYRDLTQRIDAALDAIDPAVRPMYEQARDATALMYARLRGETVLKTLQGIHDNPEAMNTYFFQNGGLARLDSIRDALSLVNQVPGTRLNGQQWFDLNMTPYVRYQTMWNASQTAIQEGMSSPLANLARAASGNQDIQQLLANKQLVALKPKAFADMEQAMGKEHFESVMGGAHTAQLFRDLDAALQKNHEFKDPLGHLYILMMQTGGASRALNALGTIVTGASGAYHYAGAPTTNFLAGAGIGGLIFFSPAVINYLATQPKRFEALIMGIRRGDAHYVERLMTQIGAHAARKLVEDKLRSGETPPPIQIRWKATERPLAVE